jgi:hypothetical protein
MEQVNLVSRRVHRDEATWREIFARQVASGLLVSEFCRQEKINPGVFRRWRVALQGMQPARKARARSMDEKPTAAFVDLGALNHGGSGCEIRLELGGGVVLYVVRG